MGLSGHYPTVTITVTAEATEAQVSGGPASPAPQPGLRFKFTDWQLHNAVRWPASFKSRSRPELVIGPGITCKATLAHPPSQARNSRAAAAAGDPMAPWGRQRPSVGNATWRHSDSGSRAARGPGPPGRPVATSDFTENFESGTGTVTVTGLKGTVTTRTRLGTRHQNLDIHLTVRLPPSGPGPRPGNGVIRAPPQLEMLRRTPPPRACHWSDRRKRDTRKHGKVGRSLKSLFLSIALESHH